jgi:hypothetical protein
MSFKSFRFQNLTWLSFLAQSYRKKTWPGTRRSFTFLQKNCHLRVIVFSCSICQHGDLELENKANDSFVPCITNIKSFGSTFQFSLETQHTIGYGQKLVIILNLIFISTDQTKLTTTYLQLAPY